MPRYIEPSSCRFFSNNQRVSDPKVFLGVFRNICYWTEKYELDGVLIYTGNEVNLDPWVLAQDLLASTKTLTPVVAVNPIYAHPFTVAKTVASFAIAYERSVLLNMITGTALNYLEALGDQLSHEQRYDRLLEYSQIVASLLRKATVSFEGQYYKIRHAQLPTRISPTLQPDFMLAGQSEAAQRVCLATNALAMTMLPPSLENLRGDVKAVHFGVITRPRSDAAWQAAKSTFPHDPNGEGIQAISMENTDSSWKRRMFTYSQAETAVNPLFWLDPFRNFQADCPYCVGSYVEIGRLFQSLASHGINTFILDIPPWEAEFRHLHGAIQAASTQPAIADSTTGPRLEMRGP